MADAPAWASFTWRDPANAGDLPLKARVAAIDAVKAIDDASGESALLIGGVWLRVTASASAVVAAISGDDILWAAATYRDPEQNSAEVAMHVRSLAIDAVTGQPGDAESIVLIRDGRFRLRVTTDVTTIVNAVKATEPGGGGGGGIGGGGSTEIAV